MIITFCLAIITFNYDHRCCKKRPGPLNRSSRSIDDTTFTSPILNLPNHTKVVSGGKVCFSIVWYELVLVSYSPVGNPHPYLILDCLCSIFELHYLGLEMPLRPPPSFLSSFSRACIAHSSNWGHGNENFTTTPNSSEIKIALWICQTEDSAYQLLCNENFYKKSKFLKFETPSSSISLLS